MQNTDIEWADKSVNPIKLELPSGKRVNACVVVSDGCRNCYAASITRHWWPKNEGKFPGYSLPLINSGKIVLVEEELQAILRLDDRIRRGKADPAQNKVFWCDMSDMFGAWVPFNLIDRCFAVMALTPNLVHQVLTKRPERLEEYLTFHVGHNGEHLYDNFLWKSKIDMSWPLPNVWLGTSVENQKAADERIPHLLKCPAAVRFLSCEPLVSDVNLVKWLQEGSQNDNRRSDDSCDVYTRGVDNGQPGSDLAAQGSEPWVQNIRQGNLLHTEESRHWSIQEGRIQEGSGNSRGGEICSSCAQSRVDGIEPEVHSIGLRSQSQGWHQRQQPSGELGVSDSITEFNSLSACAGEPSQENQIQADSESGSRNQVFIGQQIDAACSDSRNVSRVRGDSEEHLQTPKVDVVAGIASNIHWVIAGGESGSKARPCHIKWMASLRDQCQEAEVPFFLKQWGEWVPNPKTPMELERGSQMYRKGHWHDWGDEYASLRVGKKNAAPVIDGREWKEFPASVKEV